MTAKPIMIQGTASNAGKSLLTAGLGRVFRQDGLRAAPFKSQNMALNSFITRDGLEMGRAQVMQAEACRIEPDIRMNPVLLKPTSDKGSQVIVMGKPVGNMGAEEYYAWKHSLVPVIRKAYGELAAEHDIIVLEGAGSPAEINLRDGDFVNMGMARLAHSPVLIVGDIDRGGVFASLAGTMLLLPEDEKALVKGVIINKFRGDPAILAPGLRMLEDIIQVPVLGVLPCLDIKVDDEDSLTERFTAGPGRGLADIAVIRLPRISNFTDFNAFEYAGGLSLRYVRSVRELGRPDCLIIPGSKNTMGDLKWLRQSGLAQRLLEHAASGKPVIGVCGGFQMLGGHISDPHSVEEGGEMDGLGLLPVNTVFGREKVRTQARGRLSSVGGIFSGLSGLEFSGYEIHMGISGAPENLVQRGNVYGTYLHGLFDAEEVLKAVRGALLAEKGLEAAEMAPFNMEAFKEEQYDLLAGAIRASFNLEAIYDILNKGV